MRTCGCRPKDAFICAKSITKMCTGNVSIYLLIF